MPGYLLEDPKDLNSYCMEIKLDDGNTAYIDASGFKNATEFPYFGHFVNSSDPCSDTSSKVSNAVFVYEEYSENLKPRIKVS